MFTPPNIFLPTAPLHRVVLLTHMRTSSISLIAKCRIPETALHMRRTLGNSPLDANNGRHSSWCIDVSKHLVGLHMFDKQTNIRLSEDHPSGVNISQRASRKSLTIKNQTNEVRALRCAKTLGFNCVGFWMREIRKIMALKDDSYVGPLLRLIMCQAKKNKKNSKNRFCVRWNSDMLALSRSPEIADEVLKGVIRPQNGAAIW